MIWHDIGSACIIGHLSKYTRWTFNLVVYNYLLRPKSGTKHCSSDVQQFGKVIKAIQCRKGPKSKSDIFIHTTI